MLVSFIPLLRGPLWTKRERDSCGDKGQICSHLDQLV